MKTHMNNISERSLKTIKRYHKGSIHNCFRLILQCISVFFYVLHFGPKNSPEKINAELRNDLSIECLRMLVINDGFSRVNIFKSL